MSEMKVVGTYSSRYEAEMSSELLQEQGIQSIISADDCGGQLMGLSPILKNGVKLMVSEEDSAEALKVLEVLEQEQ
ncbi:MAG: hypothetical protein B1H09_05175 [Gemmatimonadaceae bacterium 4484_173]|nr:MAG: hypothetical protein B1H09_05175 [Gemmatimonadaceae bacterium 4484_173]RKZ03811.1 MAG: hypothetical protein DRQ21_04725 [Candidatus Fermentibacteria bacterium]